MFRLSRFLKGKKYPVVTKAKKSSPSVPASTKVPPVFTKTAPPTFSQAKVAAPPSFTSARTTADLSEEVKGSWKELRNSFEGKKWTVSGKAHEDPISTSANMPPGIGNLLQREKQFQKDVRANPKLAFDFNHRAKVMGYNPKDPKVRFFRIINAAMNIYILWWIYTWWTGDSKKEEKAETPQKAQEVPKSSTKEENIYAQIYQQKQQNQYQSFEQPKEEGFKTFKSSKFD